MLSASVTTESTMYCSIRISVAHTFVTLLLVSSLTSALLMISDSYVKLKGGLIPVNGGNVTGSLLLSSAVRCAAKCSEMGDACDGFLLLSTSACNSTAVGTGSCQLLSFPDLGSVVLGPVVGCQHFYVKDVCAHDDVNLCRNSAACDGVMWPRVCTCATGYIGTYCNLSKTLCQCRQ
jgi:hypothetical protein